MLKAACLYLEYYTLKCNRLQKKKKEKNLAAMQETQVQFLGLKDSLEKEMATPSSVLAWRIPWTEEPGRL